MEIKYSLDENEEKYYPATHVKAIQGLDLEEEFAQLDNLKREYSDFEKRIEEKQKEIEKNIDDISGEQYSKIQDELKTYKDKIDNINSTLSTLVGDTGWVKFQVLPEIELNTKMGAKGFETSIREVRFGNVRQKSIRLNMSNIPHNVQIAQLPTGFMTTGQMVYGAGDGNSLPIRFEISSAGEVKTYVHENDRKKSQSSRWVYTQFTWLE